MPVPIEEAERYDKKKRDKPDKMIVKDLLIYKLTYKMFGYNEFEFFTLEDLEDWMKLKIVVLNNTTDTYTTPPTTQKLRTLLNEYRTWGYLTMFTSGDKVIVTAKNGLRRLLPTGYTPP